MDRKRFTFEVPWPNFRRVRLASWLPSRGNVLFTLVIAALLILAQSVGALPLRSMPYAVPSSTATIAYQGRLADAASAPLTGTYNMIFRLYTVATGDTPLWTEQWTGSNAVRVSDGLFNVMLGSLTTLPQSAIAGRSQLFLGITVGTDDEMAPRVQLGSVPFAVQALTVPDGSVTTAKIVDGAVTSQKQSLITCYVNDNSFVQALSGESKTLSEFSFQQEYKSWRFGYCLRLAGQRNAQGIRESTARTGGTVGMRAAAGGQEARKRKNTLPLLHSLITV